MNQSDLVSDSVSSNESLLRSPDGSHSFDEYNVDGSPVSPTQARNSAAAALAKADEYESKPRVSYAGTYFESDALKLVVKRLVCLFVSISPLPTLPAR